MSSGRLECEVLVVGAGPAGSAVAAALAAQGRKVLVVEARQHPRPKACAEYASPRIVEELRHLRVPDAEWLANARPLAGMRVIRGADAVQIGYQDANGTRTAWGLDRRTFDAALAAHAVAAGAQLRERSTLEGLFWRDGRVIGAHLRTPEGPTDVACQVLIGADGARSRVAQLLGVERPVRVPRRLGLVAHYEGIAELTDHGEMHVGPGWYVGLAPLPGGSLNVGMAVPLDGASRQPAAERFEAAIAGIPAVAARLAGKRRLTPIRGASPIGHRVSRAAGPGWMLIGDAAGFIDPFTGEGIYRALRSARAAAEALADGDDGAAERYLAARRGAFAAKDALTWLVQGMLAAPPLMGYTLRRLAERPSVAARLGSALGDCRPASDALSPLFLARVLRP
ncbi:MAG: NAD(P)/FAD-dependent oxidoreductase [Chloroflexi bacterium]|nr:MAG: NAD(P)/FAD-dependent oxidoreductase [Chloroflexota bacterium]